MSVSVLTTHSCVVPKVIIFDLQGFCFVRCKNEKKESHSNMRGKPPGCLTAPYFPHLLKVMGKNNTMEFHFKKKPKFCDFLRIVIPIHLDGSSHRCSSNLLFTAFYLPTKEVMSDPHI